MSTDSLTVQPLAFTLPAAPTTPPLTPAAPPASPELDMLASMFPALDAELLSEVLSHHGGNVEQAVSTLLELSSEGDGEVDPELTAQAAQLDLDAEMALRAQEEIDQEAAVSLQNALRDEDQRARAAAQPSARANAAASSVAGGAKSLFSRVRSAGLRRPPKEAAARLLDGQPSDAADAAAPLVMEAAVGQPAAAPLYTPPPPPPSTLPVPPPIILAALPLAAPAPSASTGASADAPAGSPPSGDVSTKYNSRVGRARVANAARLGRSGSVTAVSPPAVLQIDPSQFVDAPAAADGTQQGGPAEGILI